MPLAETLSKKSSFSYRLYLVLAFFGPVLIILGFYIFFHNRSILSFKSLPKAQNLATQISPIVKVTVPSLKIDLPVEESQIVDGIWQISDRGASHLVESANAGEKGNIIVYGHNKKIIFGSLPYIKPEAQIDLTTQDGKVHSYKVVKMATVKPDNLTFIMPTEDETLTLYTCNGFLDSTRFTLQAKPI